MHTYNIQLKNFHKNAIEYLVLYVINFSIMYFRECFQSIASNLAELYSKLSSGRGGDDDDNDILSRSLEGLVYPALRAHLLPSEIETPLHDTFIEIAALEQLYKVFERC